MEEFLKNLVRELREKMLMTGDEYFIDTHDVVKNNDTVLHSIVIRKGGEQISKNIYVEPYFELNMRGTPVHEIAQNIIELSKDKSYEEHIEENLVDFNDYDVVKEKLIVRVLSRELNEEFLKDKLYIPVDETDLVAVLYVLVSKDESGIASTAVSKNFMKVWEVKSVESLFSQAFDNTQKIFPICIKNMGKFITDTMQEANEDMVREVGQMMHILTNDVSINGATSMLYKNILSEFAQIHEVEAIVILPSSRHEVLLLPQKGDIDYRYCEEMVREINSTVVSEQDVLSNHIYIYDVTADEITMWEE